MKILMTSSVAPTLHSGVGSVEWNLIEQLRRKGVGVGEYFPRLSSMALTDFYAGLRLSKRAGELGCDVIHGHTDITWNTPDAFRTFHGVAALGEKFYREEREHALMPRHKQKAYFVLHKAFESRSAKKNINIAVSNYVRDALIRYCGAPPERTATVYNGIDAKTFSPNRKSGGEFRSRHGIPQNAIVLTWVGHLEFNKGIAYLVRLANELVHRHEIHFAIRSPAGKEDLLSRGLDSSCLNRITLLGMQEDLASFYNAGDIHLLTSVYEPFCLTLLEAMSCGKPVVASRSGGHGESITPQSGFLTPLRDSGAMAEKVAELAESDSMRKRMGAEARRVILRGYTKEIMAGNYIKAYKRFLE
ncbi:glycosyltransferase family 4 protein [Candidatus Micrarchaeota archaeon]|nr:glycosyltransferase family 4 protein [Candidatus Micrarchaeota archaeon]